jgi:hypothetical protein
MLGGWWVPSDRERAAASGAPVSLPRQRKCEDKYDEGIRFPEFSHGEWHMTKTKSARCERGDLGTKDITRLDPVRCRGKWRCAAHTRPEQRQRGEGVRGRAFLTQHFPHLCGQ